MKAPRTRDRERTARRILDAALVEFSDHGYGGARIDAVAERSGASKPMIYSYFGDKDALYGAALRDAYVQIRAGESELEFEALAPRAAVGELVSFTLSHYRRNPWFIRMLNTENATFELEGGIVAQINSVDEARAIGAECLVMVVGGLAPGSKDIDGARELIAEGLAKTLEHARQANVPIAIEPLHPMYAADRACVNTTAQALDLCDALGEGIGVALDVYHVWWDPDLANQIRRAGRERLLAFHICDWLVPTTDLLLDRGMPGDGVIDIAGIHAMFEAEGYDALVEIEIFSENDWWQRDPDVVLRTMVERGRTLGSPGAAS